MTLKDILFKKTKTVDLSSEEKIAHQIFEECFMGCRIDDPDNLEFVCERQKIRKIHGQPIEGRENIRKMIVDGLREIANFMPSYMNEESYKKQTEQEQTRLQKEISEATDTSTYYEASKLLPIVFALHKYKEHQSALVEMLKTPNFEKNKERFSFQISPEFLATLTSPQQKQEVLKSYKSLPSRQDRMHALAKLLCLKKNSTQKVFHVNQNYGR